MSILRSLLRLLPDSLEQEFRNVKEAHLAEMNRTLLQHQQARDAIRDAQIQAKLGPIESRLKLDRDAPPPARLRPSSRSSPASSLPRATCRSASPGPTSPTSSTAAARFATT